MNRYVIEGAIKDAQSGKRVTLIGHNMPVLLGLIDAAPDVERSLRANGSARVDFMSGGCVRLIDHRHGFPSGLVADVLFLDVDAARDYRTLEQARIAATAVGGEVIRA